MSEVVKKQKTFREIIEILTQGNPQFNPDDLDTGEKPTEEPPVNTEVPTDSPQKSHVS